MNHYGRLGGSYPGERACRLPPRKDDNLAFRDTYLIDLGEGLSEEQFDDAADKVAAYLYMDTATTAGSFFRACRDAEPRHADTRNAELPLRTFGVHQFSCLQDDIVAVAVEHLCRYSVDRWLMGTVVEVEPPVLKRTNATVNCGTDRTMGREYSHLQVAAERFVESFRLDVDSLIQEVFRHVEHEFGGPANVFFREQIEQLPIQEARSSPDGIATLISQFTKNVESLLGSRHAPADHTRPDPGTLEAAIGPSRKRSALKRADAIREFLLDMVDDETSRVRGAHWLAKWLSGLCKSTEERVNELRKNVEAELTETERLLTLAANYRGRGRDRAILDELPDLLEQYCRHRLYERVVLGVAKIAKSAKGQVAAVRDELVDFERELRHIGSHFDTSRTFDSLVGDDDVGADKLLESVGHIMADGIGDLTEKLQQRLQNEVLKDAGGLRKLLNQGGDARNRLPGTIRSIARTTVVGLMKTLDVADVMFHDEEQADNEATMLSDSLASAKPRLLRCGGAKRLLMMLPRGSTHVRPIEILHEQMNETPSVTQNHDGDFVLCYEVERISLTQAAVTIIEERRDFAEFAGRLHTRTDVAWSPLPDVD